jgi:proteasome accessory factor C
VSDQAAGRLGRRLRRILLLLPYAIRHPGVTIDELSRKFGVKRADLLEDLQLVFLCGLPGYGPGDLIDVTLEEDRVFVRMADYFAAPLRLTPAEALALYAGGSALAALPGMEEADALRTGLAKLARALGTGSDGAGVEVLMDPGPQTHLDALQQALSDRRRVSLEYFSASRGELTTRTVEPWGLIAALGRAYLIGWDHLASDERMFRTDRIKNVTLLDEPAEVPEDFDPERYKGAWLGHGGQGTVTLEISPQAARWFEDYYPVESSADLDDGWRAVTLVVGGTRWAATLALTLGPHVRAVKPTAIWDEARALAKRIAARYQ